MTYLVEDRVNETNEAFIHSLIHCLSPHIHMRGQHRYVWMAVIPEGKAMSQSVLEKEELENDCCTNLHCGWERALI